MTEPSELRRDLPIFEIYSGAHGSRIEIHPWFYAGGHQYLGTTRVLPPGTGKAPAHVHPGITQHSLLLSGPQARYRSGHRSKLLTPDEIATIPPGTPHVDPYNASDHPIVVRTLYSPGPVWFMLFGKTLGHAIRDGTTNSHNELPFLHLLMMLGTPGSVTFAATIPIPLQRHVLLPLATRIARRRGYAPAVGLRAHIFR